MPHQSIKPIIKKAYNKIANYAQQHGAAAHRHNICGGIFDIIANEYPAKKGYIEDANLGLGCGFPFEYVENIKGKTIADIGCAAGVDVFIMSKLVGKKGKVFGFDLSPKLIARANNVMTDHNITNCFFEEADIEKLIHYPVKFDAITSNGVLSLIPNKTALFENIFSLLKPTAVFCFSDIVTTKILTDNIKKLIIEYTGCLNGINTFNDYKLLMKQAGFINIKLVNKRNVGLSEPIKQALKNDSVNPSNALQIITIKAEKK